MINILKRKSNENVIFGRACRRLFLNVKTIFKKLFIFAVIYSQTSSISTVQLLFFHPKIAKFHALYINALFRFMTGFWHCANQRALKILYLHFKLGCRPDVHWRLETRTVLFIFQHLSSSSFLLYITGKIGSVQNRKLAYCMLIST